MANKVKQKRRLKRAIKQRENESLKAAKIREEKELNQSFRNILEKRGFFK